jgi:hypothetical protein
MRSKNSSSLTEWQRNHLRRVKELQCSVCDAQPPSDAHHIKQGQHYTAVALCYACHQGRNGWHGEKTIWRIKKMDEIDALAVTIERMMTSA